MPIFGIGTIHFDMLPPGGEVFKQLSLLMGQPIQLCLAAFDVPVKALSLSQRLACKVGGQLEFPHRLSSSVCCGLALALLRFIRFLLLDGLYDCCNGGCICESVPDDGSGNMAIAEGIFEPRLEP